MDLIVEKMAESKSLVESWGEVIDVTEFMTDSSGFFNTNGLGAFTQIYDRADGRYRPVYTNESDLKLIRAMSWLLVEKVPMAQAWVNRLLDYTIGTGFDWTIKADDKRLEKAIQLYVRESLDVSNWSTELERESYMREVADGEFIGEHIYEDGQCMVVSREADELTEPATKGELEEWLGLDFVPSWTFGVLTKESLPERPIGYHFVRNSAGTDWDYVPADRVCMWKRNVRSRGKRGFSDFYKPHLYLLRADRVLTNTAEGAATQAAIAYIVEHRDGTQRQADNIVKRFAPPTGKVDPLTGLAQRRRRMLPGTRLDVPEGQAYKAGLLGSNNSGIYIEVMESALRLAGSVHAFVEGMLTGSYANNNFASALVAEGPFMQGRLAEQSQRKERMRDMILKIIKLGASKGRFRSAGFDSWDAVRDRVTVEVIPSRIIPVDHTSSGDSKAERLGIGQNLYQRTRTRYRYRDGKRAQGRRRRAASRCVGPTWGCWSGCWPGRESCKRFQESGARIFTLAGIIASTVATEPQGRERCADGFRRRKDPAFGRGCSAACYRNAGARNPNDPSGCVRRADRFATTRANGICPGGREKDTLPSFSYVEWTKEIWCLR